MRPTLVWLRQHLDTLVWQLLPGICILCNERSGIAMDLCVQCRAALPTLGRACRTCALPLTNLDEQFCGTCRAQPPPFARTVAALSYAEPVTGMIHRLKFGGSRIDARVLGGLLGDRIRDVYGLEPLPQMILPVPLSSARLFRRGHNQAALLARWVGSTLDLRVDYHCCRRIRNTPPQAGLRRRARLHNLSGAFAVRGNLSVQHVAILDDVITTGSTAAALTRRLLAAGAQQVDVWAAARTPEPNSPTGLHEFGGTAPASVLLE
jgi:ComF family protein